MDADICKTFTPLRNVIFNSDDGISYRFTDDNDYKDYCTGGNCNDDTDKMNARCLHIFDALFKDKSEFETDAKGNIYIVQYILIWLSYVFSLIKSEEKGSLNEFYNKYIETGDSYKKEINEVTNKNYKDLIDKNKYILSMDKSIISKLYDVFSTLCNIYIEVDGSNSNCEKSSEKANQFVETYKKIIIDHNIGENIRYFYVLINLLTDYDNLKKKCEKFPSTPDIKKIISEHVSEATSSSITSKLIPILSILVAIPIFLGIAYKYSLFGFRKRFQKQHLREKLKK
ncbi:YIR protein [Plasmodium yoelii]|uniref:YIR protein n=1 Tax=Plasmodium yoelii TaxID=5861 RepID=A0A077X9A7_PLAYE|nr:YIR protein [Plasmodium yoelii]